MASPQLENGYAQISNEILEAFARVPSLGSEAFQVLMLMLRRTYGFHQKEAEMTISFIAKGTGMKRRNVVRATERLVSKRILIHVKSVLSLNKNYDEWVVSKRTPSVQTDTGVVSKRITQVVSKRTPNKDTYKNTPVKDIATTVAGNDVNKVLEAFQMKLNPTINYGNKTQRRAAQDLLDLMGSEKLLRTIDYAAAIRTDQFAPMITTPYQLKEKLAQLTNYYQKQTSKKSNAITI